MASAPYLEAFRALQPEPFRPYALADVAKARMERERVEMPGFTAWAESHKHRSDFSGWLGTYWFTPSSPKAPRVVAPGRRVVLPSTGEAFDLDVMELRSPYLGEVYSGGRSRPRWSHEDAEALAAFSGGLAQPSANRAGMPTEPLVELDAYNAWWQWEMLIGTHCELDPETGRWWGSGTWPAAEDLRATKLYISVLSHAFTTHHIKRWVRGEPKESLNPFRQPQYAHLVTRLSFGWAQEMMALFDAHRVTVDAVWVPERLADQAARWSLERWHFVLRPKRRYTPGQGKWGTGAPRSNVVPQSEAVREALSSSVRGGLPRSPLTPLMSFQERAQMAGYSYPETGQPPLDWTDDSPPPALRPGRPKPTPAEVRAARLARVRERFEAGQLEPPPVQPWQAEVRERLVSEGKPDPFLPPPPDQPWMTGGWSLVAADVPDDFDWRPVVWAMPVDDDCTGADHFSRWDSRGPPVIDWTDEEEQ
jgi:hypothetical protein